MAKFYRRLEMGEIIQATDEYDDCCDPWRDDPVWVPARNVGEPAPDPKYPAHRQYRRLVAVTCTRCEGDGKAHGADRPFEWKGPGSYPGPCPVCNGKGKTPTPPDAEGE